MPNPSHRHSFVSQIAPHTGETFDLELKMEAAKHFASIAIDLADDSRDDRRASLRQTWSDWSEHVIEPLTPHLESALIESPSGSSSSKRDRNYAWICLRTPVANRGVTSPLVTTLGLRPAATSEQDWNEISEERSSVSAHELRRVGTKQVVGDFELPNPGVQQIMSKYGKSPRIVAVSKKRFSRKTTPTYEIDYGSMADGLDRKANQVAQSSQYDSINFRLAKDPVLSPFMAGSSISAAGTVYQLKPIQHVATEFDVIAVSAYIDEEADKGEERAVLSEIIDSLNAKTLSAAAKGTLNRDIATDILIEAAKPRAEDIKRLEIVTTRIFDLITKSQDYKDLVI